MALSIGIVGLPNVGKSTTFNALTRTQIAQIANYPFCTIEPNRAVVPVPDSRVEKLAQLTGVGRSIHVTIEFVDIAGLVKGASKGEGLGNQFLGHIRDTDAIVHVVRCFEDENVVHVSPSPEPRVDVETINLELVLSDWQQLERKIERLSRQAKGDARYRPLLDTALSLQGHLDEGQMLANYPHTQDAAFISLNNELRFLTAKPTVYLVNIDEAGLTRDSHCTQEATMLAGEHGAQAVVLCAGIEAELADMEEYERAEYLQLLGIDESALDKVIRASYELLGLISFFTMNENEVRAWHIPKGTTAASAAGVIHTDFETGFIRAEVIAYEDFVQHGSMAAARAAGAVRIEGRDYEVVDGDILYIRFRA